MFENGHTAPEHISPGPEHQLMTPGPISSWLVPQPPSPTPNVPPTKNDRDTLFCPMFDEYFNPSPSVAQPVLEVAVQDIPSTSISQTIKEAQSHVIPEPRVIEVSCRIVTDAIDSASVSAVVFSLSASDGNGRDSAMLVSSGFGPAWPSSRVPGPDPAWPSSSVRWSDPSWPPS
ncbi:hypothetical protein Tco_1404976 [Tanacetum coccineum]